MVSDDGSWVEYDVNGAAFFLGKFEDWKTATSGPAVAFEVEDMEHTIQVLRDEKVPIFKEPFETPGCWISVIGDSEGNSLMIHKCKPGR
jgi:predicted enzyme related to lactoylglutathione lyase